MVKEFDTSPLLTTQDLTFEVGPQAHGTLVSEAGCVASGWLQNLQVILDESN